MKVTGTDGKEYTIEPRADWDGAYLRGAYLSGADLRGTDLSRARLREAVWNGEAVFPKRVSKNSKLSSLQVA